MFPRSSTPVAPRSSSPAAPRPSERPTLKTLAPVDAPSSGHSNTQIIDVSAAALDSSEGLSSTLDAIVPHATWRPWRSGGLPSFLGLSLVAAACVSEAAVLATGWATGVSEGLRNRGAVPHEVVSERTPRAMPSAPGAALPTAGTCASIGESKVIATRANFAPGLEITVVDREFNVAFAAGATDGVGLRLAASSSRVVERIHVRTKTAIRHVTAVGGRAEDDAIDLKIDADGARSLFSEDAETSTYRVAVAGGWVHASSAGKVRALWPVPAPRVVKVERRVPAAAVPFFAVPAPDVRASVRHDGGVVVALRRASTLWLGIADGSLTPDGPLVTLIRPGAEIGMPAVTPWGGGGVAAWAERPSGEREWAVMVASFDGADEGKREAPSLRPVGAGMSPSIVSLPDGDLLLAFTVGKPGAHRVLVQRLGRHLEPRGGPIFASQEGLNAGQPAIAVAADGRALVAFFGATAAQSAHVFATPLACDSSF